MFVEHPRYGKGEAIRSRYAGFELQVKFEDGRVRWIQRDFLRFVSKKQVLKKCEEEKTTIPAEKFRSLNIIEALRMGVVPHRQIEEFTVGREEEISKIKHWLESPESGTLQIVGEYGTGKTHLLNCIYHVALKNGWAVSYVELDHLENPPYKPKSVYKSIVSSFKFGEKEEGDFREFITKVAESRNTYEILEHPFLGGIIDKIMNDRDWLIEEDWEWIEGGFTKGYPKYNQSTAASIYCNILNGLGWAAKKIGLKGFLVLFDEAENVDLVQYRNQFYKGWNVFKGLVYLSEKQEDLLREKTYKKTAGYFGELTGLQYFGIKPNIKFAWRMPPHLKIVFAFTPNELVDKYPFNYVQSIELEHLKAQHFNELIQNIRDIYKLGYSFEASNEDLGRFEFPNHTRKFIKACVEAHDILRLGEYD